VEVSILMCYSRFTENKITVTLAMEFKRQPSDDDTLQMILQSWALMDWIQLVRRQSSAPGAAPQLYETAEPHASIDASDIMAVDPQWLRLEMSGKPDHDKIYQYEPLPDYATGTLVGLLAKVRRGEYDDVEAQRPSRNGPREIIGEPITAWSRLLPERSAAVDIRRAVLGYRVQAEN